jgi:hypothetical protein
MKCRECKHSFSLSVVGLGDSSSPGDFFYILLVVGATTYFLWDGARPYAVFTGAVCVFTFFALLPAWADHNFAYGRPKYPNCETENWVYPWSF